MSTSTTTPYDARELVYVPIGGGINYVFRTNIQTSVRTALGIEAVTDTLTNAVYQCNSPKPAKATKKKAGGSDSSFCDSAKIPSLSKDGWSIRRPQYRGIIPAGTTGKKVVSVSATVGTTLKYAWNMPLTLYTNISTELGALGIDECTAANLKTYIWGSSIPRPAKASKFDPTKEATYSTFVGSAKEDDLPAGWGLAQEHILWEDTSAQS